MSLKQALILISYTSPLLLVLGLVIALFYLKRLSKPFIIIALYFLVALIVDVICRAWGLFSTSKNNLFIIPIFGIIELAIFSLLYYKYMLKSTSKMLMSYIIIALTFVFLDIIFIDYQAIKSFQSFGKILDNLSIIFYCFLFIWQSIKAGEKVEKVAVQINFGVLLYFSINLLIYLPINFLINANSNVIYYFWMINLFSTIIFYVFLIHLTWLNGRTHKHLPLG